MELGTVKWFSEKKGYGFIDWLDHRDLFVHYSAIQMKGFKNLIQDQKVSFETEQGKNGLQAANVTVIE